MTDELLRKILSMTDDRLVDRDDRGRWAYSVVGAVHHLVKKELEEQEEIRRVKNISCFEPIRSSER